jgi:hypothetical protein
MEIHVNEKVFPMPWEVSTRLDGWNDLKTWFNQAIDNGYEYDNPEDPTSYPRVIVTSSLPQQIVIGVCYATIGFGYVALNGTWSALWYCAPSEDAFFQFLDRLRITEHDFQPGEGTYCVTIGGTPKLVMETT